MTDKNSPEEVPSRHWADHAADELIGLHPKQEKFVCASGISPSGMIHIGNFREVITVDLVARGLQTRGKQVHFLYSWDDYDAMRKVPANLPKQDELKAHLRKPISDIPDPFGTHATYATHFEKQFENDLLPMGIKPEYIYQNQAYKSCQYADGIRTALENQKTIVEILNQSRTEPLPDSWWCVSIYCPTCGKDITDIKTYKAPYTLHYSCKVCKKEADIHFDKEPGVKLLWRVDWPMRWNFEKVDFEPGGKDHSSTGGSYETGCEITRKIWKREPPFYVQYDFVLAKGIGAKLSSSSGRLITLGEALEIYEPAVIRWIFAGRKPNLDFTIAFDLDVIRTYDDFDRCERFAYGNEQGDDKKVSYERRIYELSCVEFPIELDMAPPQFPFRHLCNLLQIHQGAIDRAQAEYGDLNTADVARFKARATRAWKWITTYAPEDFRFTLRSPEDPVDKTTFPEAIRGVMAVLEKPGSDQLAEDALASAIYDVMKANGLDAKRFFPEVYRILVGKSSGPKLASFFLAMGPQRGADLLKGSL